MKKVFSVLIILVFVLSGCSNINKVRIKNNNWDLSRIAETNTDRVIFCSEENNLKFPDAKVIDLELVADKSTITITSSSTGESWTLEYRGSETAETNSKDGLVYDIYYKNEGKQLKGYASTGVASKSDVDDDYYLIITVGGYSLFFVDTLD